MQVRVNVSLTTVFLLLLLLSACRNDALVMTAAPLPTRTLPSSSATPGFVRVRVEGAVNRPGDYTLSPDSLVDDAVRAAGGPAPEADLERINLARVVDTGERIYVPRFGEVLPTPTPYGLSADGRIDINLAGTELLETLPGIGPAMADRIVTYRETQGPFKAIEEIQEVKGIGASTYAKIQDRITASEPR